MSNASVNVELAKELTLKALDRGDVYISSGKGTDMKAVGEAIATLYNTILENLKAPQ